MIHKDQVGLLRDLVVLKRQVPRNRGIMVMVPLKRQVPQNREIMVMVPLKRLELEPNV
jgi:hypothetical protein